MIKVPEGLKKKGITGARDNIQPDQQLNVSAGVFMAFFGNDLLEHYSKKHASCEKKTVK